MKHCISIKFNKRNRSSEGYEIEIYYKELVYETMSPVLDLQSRCLEGKPGILKHDLNLQTTVRNSFPGNFSSALKA